MALLSSNSDGIRLSSGGSKKSISIKGMFKQLFSPSSNDDILIEAITKSCNNTKGSPKEKHINTIIRQMHDNTSDIDGATPDRIVIIFSTLKWLSNNIITNKILTTLLILQHFNPSRMLHRYHEAIPFLQQLIDSEDLIINSINRQYALFLLNKINFHITNGSLLSKFFTSIPTSIKSIPLEIDYSPSISTNELLLIVSMLLSVQNEIIKLINLILSVKTDTTTQNEIFTYQYSLQPIVEESFCVIIALSNLLKKIINQDEKNKSITMSYINQYNDQLESMRSLYMKVGSLSIFNMENNNVIPSVLPEFFPIV